MIYTVTVNPCLDEEKWFKVDRLVPGTNRTTASDRYPGGKGIDVSRAIHAFGCRSVATGFMGGHIGEFVLGQLGIEDIKCDFVDINGETRTNVICHLEGGKEIRINSSGPFISGTDYYHLLSRIRGFHDAEAALVCGSVPRGMETIYSYNQILLAFKQGNRDCLTFLDTGEKHTNAALGAECPPDFIKPNIYEFHRLLRVNVNIEGLAPQNADLSLVDEDYLIGHYCQVHDELPTAWERLVERILEFAAKYPDVNVLLSVSGLGALVLHGTEILHAFYCGDLKISTTVGAGDSFLGGFASSYIRRRPGNLDEALRTGVAAATARMLGHDREYGYIDQDKLWEVSASDDLRLERFEPRHVGKYVKKVVMKCFPTRNGRPGNP